MTAPSTNSKTDDTLFQHNPLVLPVCLLLINAAFLVALSIAVHAWISDEHKLTMMLAIIAYFSLSTVLMIVHCIRLFRAIELPVESACATLIAAMPAERASELKGTALTAIAEQCSTELENLRYASQLIADYSSDLLFSLNEHLSIVELNASAQRALHSSKINLIGASFMDLVLPADRNALKVYFEKLIHQAQDDSLVPAEFRLQVNAEQLIDIRLTVEFSKSMRTLYCIGQDVTAEKEIQRLRSEITSMVSHDLRAPVSSLSFFIENLLSGDYGLLNDKGRLQVSRSRENVAQLLRLINQLLDAEKLDAGEIKLDIKIVPVSEIVDTATKLLLGLAEQKHVQLVIPECETLVHADFDRSVQILSNLLSNAIKFSPENARIEITELRESSTTKILVRDYGPGIPFDHQGELFQRFKSWTIDSASAPSSGLGLYLARKLSELQSGSLDFETPTDSKGSIFLFSMNVASESDLPGYID